jgi:hypothetical protein
MPNAQILTDLDAVVRTVVAVLHGQVPIEAGQPIPPPLRGRGNSVLRTHNSD